MKANWGAAVCKGDMGRLSIDDTKAFPEFATGPAIEPVVLQRDGKRYEYNGETTLPSGAEIRVATARDKLSLSLREMDKGSWVLFELPGFTSTVGGTPQASLEALRAAGTTSYFKDDKGMWVKLVVEDPVPKGPIVVQVGQLRAQANIEVRRQGSVATAAPDDAGRRQ
jgi:cell migration-inducing and hyaluronan-binding protein